MVSSIFAFTFCTKELLTLNKQTLIIMYLYAIFSTTQYHASVLKQNDNIYHKIIHSSGADVRNYRLQLKICFEISAEQIPYKQISNIRFELKKYFKS